MEVNPVDENGRTTPRVMLQRRLRRSRERAGLSVRALAEKVDYPYGYLSRVENGKQLPSDALAEALDTFFDTDGLYGELLEMSRANLIADYSRSVVAREPEALRIQVFTSSIVPGLLQVEGYARSLFRESLPGESPEALDERVQVRMSRQRVLQREVPPYYWAVLDEAALRRSVGGRACMREQLAHILKAAESLRTTVQVIPFEQGAHSMLGGSLTLHTFADGGTIALVESFANGEPVEAPSRLIELTQLFDVAHAKALPEAESLALVHRYLEEYEDEDDS